MSENSRSRGTVEGEGRALVWFKEHAAVIGRVAMALLGDARRAELALEQVARELGGKQLPDGVKPLPWLLGQVRLASAFQLSNLPLRTRSTGSEVASATLDGPPVSARCALAALPPTEREAVVLSLVGGLDVQDVATASSVDVATAKKRISRGVEQLLRMRGGES